jgi:hypothetical protein
MRRILVVAVGGLVVLWETKAIVFESQTRVVESRRAVVTNIAISASLPRKRRSGVSFRRGEHQRQGNGRGDQSAPQRNGFESARIIISKATRKHDSFPGLTPV